MTIVSLQTTSRICKGRLNSKFKARVPRAAKVAKEVSAPRNLRK